MDVSFFFELIVRDKNSCYFVEGIGLGYWVINIFKVFFMIVIYVFYY